MQAISLRPQQRLILNKRIALFVLVVLIAIVPALSLPLSMLMPLFACPLMKGKKPWIAMIALPLPALIVWLNGFHPAYAAGLVLVTALPAIIAFRLRVGESARPEGFLIYTFAMAFAVGFSLWTLYLDAWQAGTGLSAYVAGQVEQWVMSHPQRTQLLYQAMASGLLPVPEGYKQVTLLNLVLDPVFLGEIRLMLNTRIMEAVELYLPQVFVNTSILLGFFIHLRIQRMWGAYLVLNKAEPQKVSVALAPSYATFRIPARWHGVLLIFCLAYLLTSGAEGYWLRLVQLMYYSFETIYQLQGGAIICAWFMRKNHDKRVLGGIVTAMLFLMTPFVLFVIGCFDNVFSFRSYAEDDKNEREKNEEEEP